MLSGSIKQPLLCIAALLALGACGDKNGEKSGNMSAGEVADQLAAVKIEPGEWEATNEIVSASAPGLPKEALAQMIGRKTTARNCVTPEQAAKPDANFLAAQKNSNCSYRGFSMQDGKIAGTMTCQGGDMPGKMVMTMKARTTGHRVGDCA